MIVIGRTDMLEDDHRMKKEYENIDSLKALKAYEPVNSLQLLPRRFLNCLHLFYCGRM